MQMAAPPPGSDAERPPSPSSGTGMPKFSLLGQQLHYGSPLPGQQAPQPQPQPQLQEQSQQQHHDQNQAQQQQQQQQQQGRSGLGFSLGSNPQQQQHLHQLLPFQGQGQGRGHQGQHGYQQGLPFGLGHGYGVQQKLLEADAGAGFGGRGDLMSTLGIIHQGIGQVQALLPLMAPGGPPNSALAHQQAATAQRLAAVISQLAMAAAAMLPAAQQHAMQQPPQSSEQQLSNGFVAGSSYGLYQQPGGSILGSLPSAMGSGLLGGGYGSSPNVLGGGNLPGQQQPQQAQPPHVGNQGGALVVNTPRNSIAGSSMSSVVPATVSSAAVAMGPDLLTGGPQVPAVADHSAGVMSRTVDDDPGSGSRDEDDDVDGDNLPPGSYDLIEMEAVEILAEHTHFCEICGKGFKRDANLRMHMRGHGDEYKTPAALARPDRSGQEPVTVRPRRYSCPCVGCKRNKKHRKFQPLKTMLCVKNHYRRSHCPKSLTCTKCKTKRFSVMADLKTHEKHCGRDKWQCSCGTTFSRKDKLLGHIGLFQGHTPAVPLQEMEESGMDGSSVYSSGNGGNGGLGTVVGAGYSSTAGTPSSTPNDPQPARGLMQSPSMLHGLFTSNFLQGPSSTN